MRFKLLLIFALAPFFTNSQINSYIEFPDSNVVWNFHYSLNCFQNGTGNENYSIEMDGDTIINSMVYHKLNIPYIESFTTGSCHFPTIGYKGAIREDVQQRKVYFVPPMETAEKLLYDFSMKVGDTVKGYTQELFAPSMVNTVISIDSVMIDGIFHKRWFLNDCYDEYLIEGFGSTFGLIEQSNFCNTDLPEFELICLNKEGNGIYPSSASSCDLITSLVEKNVPPFHLRVFPNPVQDQLCVEISTRTHVKPFKMLIYDTQGRKIKEKEFAHGNHKVDFPVQDMESGVYFFRLTDGHKIDHMKKVVVQ